MNKPIPNQDSGDLIVCRCEGITRVSIVASIHGSGACTVNQVKKLTRAGMGMCQGRTCSTWVEGLLSAEAHVPLGTEAFKTRPPVRPVPLLWLAAIADHFTKPVKKITAAVLWGPNNPFGSQPMGSDKKG